MNRVNILRRVIHTRCMSTHQANINQKDVFGTLSESGSKSLAIKAAEEYIEDDPDGYDKEEFDIVPRKNAYYYKYEISKYARQGGPGLKRALELFQTMKAKDRLAPTLDNFSPLIYGCAKAGYTKKAFELYGEWKKIENRVPNSMVTCLFNACAESPFQEYGLKRLDWFLDHLRIDCNKELNKIHYHSAIKAYGKLGELEKASNLVREMIDKNILPDTETFNMLLIGCVSNKEAGTSLALRIYKRLRYYGLRPSYDTFMLMLRCIRDCDMGSDLLIKKTLKELPDMTNFDQRLLYKRLLKSRKFKKEDVRDKLEWAPLISDLGESLSVAVKDSSESESLIEQENDKEQSLIINQFSEQYESSVLPPSDDHKLPNLLSDDHLDLIRRIESIKFDMIKTNKDRLMLFGGLKGYLEKMVEDKCQPDEKTFSTLLPFVGKKRHDQMEYFRLAQEYNIKRDSLFYNLLIRHICDNHADKKRLEKALNLLDEMHKDGQRPNISTFESLALGCNTWRDAKRLIADVERCGFVVSHVIIARIFRSAVQKQDYDYINSVIALSYRYNFCPTRSLVDKLEEKRVAAYEILVAHEKGRLTEDKKPDWLHGQELTSLEEFTKKFGLWLKSVKVLDDDHPWEQYRVETGSKRDGFMQFVHRFKALEQVKQEALKKGQSLGNLDAKAKRVLQTQNQPLQ